MRALLAALVIAAPGVHHTPAGMHAAQHGLLRHADLGKAWVAGATPKTTGSLACGGARTAKGVTETGAAVSPTYRGGASGPFVSQSTFVYDTVSGAARTYDTVARRNALRCLAASLTTGGDQKLGVAFVLVKRQVLPAPRVPGAVVAAYRVEGRAVSQAQRVKVYVDVLLVRRGAAITQISLSTFSKPMTSSEERRVARAAAARL
jgi:hypothetical protein